MSKEQLTLCLDVGNSNVLAGVYDHQGTILLRFRKTSSSGASADEFGVFFKSVLRENDFDPKNITRVGIASVVPNVVYSVRRASQKYFNIDPFVLKAGVKTGLNILYKNPSEVGADRIANAVAASKLYPGKDCIIVDFGTATTFDVLSEGKKYLGGAIAPGLKLSMEALEENTAKLPSVEILRPEFATGKSTIESIQSGLYFGHVGMVKELCKLIENESFLGKKPILLATGGFSHLFFEEKLFDQILPDLVLDGLYHTMNMNEEEA